MVLNLTLCFRCSLNDYRTIILCQGQFKIQFRKEPCTASSWILSSYNEISDFLSSLHWLSSWSSPSIFQVDAHFLSPLYPLLGISDLSSPEGFREPTRIIPISSLACLIWILSIFLDHAQSPLQLERELQDLKTRHGLGSPMMLCWLLLGKGESFELHPRSWAVVRLINIIKMWDISKQQNLMTLLHGYLLGNQTTEARQQQYDSVIEGIMEDLATLTT
jgi:hypothetical protein